MLHTLKLLKGSFTLSVLNSFWLERTFQPDALDKHLDEALRDNIFSLKEIQNIIRDHGSDYTSPTVQEVIRNKIQESYAGLRLEQGVLKELTGSTTDIVNRTLDASHDIQMGSTTKRAEVREDLINIDVIDQAPTLRKWSSGPAVIELKRFMNKYFQKNHAIDDNTFNDTLFNDIKAFQNSVKITQDGIVGPNTKKAIKQYMADNIRQSITNNSPENIFSADDVSTLEMNEKLDQTQAKLDALNQLIVRGAEVSEALEAYLNGGQRNEIISDDGWIWGIIRQALGHNNFNDFMSGLDEINTTGRQNINNGITTILGEWKAKQFLSPQRKKDLTLVAGSLLLSSFNSVSIPLFHVRNPLSHKLVDAGMNLEQANNFAEYIKQTQWRKEFESNKEYVSDHGVDALDSTDKLKHTLREYGISENEIDAALQGEIWDVSEKIRTVTQSFLTHIVARDLDALTKWSFSMVGKFRYIWFWGRWEAIPGNSDVTIPKRSLIGDAKFGAARRITKKIKAEIGKLEDREITIAEVMATVDERMKGIKYLLDDQAEEIRSVKKSDRILSATNALDKKVDYIDELHDNAGYFDAFVEQSWQDREFVRKFAILHKFDSIATILNNFPANPEVVTKLSSLWKSSKILDFKTILNDKDVSIYFQAITDVDSFKNYRLSQLKSEDELNQIDLGWNQHGLPIDRGTPWSEVIEQMKNNTANGSESVLTSIERTFIDNGITTISQADIEKAIGTNWTAIDINQLEGMAINTGRWEGTDNDTITSFAELARKRGDTFIFYAPVKKTIQYTDKEGDTHTLDYTYDLYFRPECKNPIIHPGIIQHDKTTVIREELPDFNTDVPALIQSTVPIFVTVGIGGSSNPTENGWWDGEVSTRVSDGNANDISGNTTQDVMGMNSANIPDTTTVTDISWNNAL